MTEGTPFRSKEPQSVGPRQPMQPKELLGQRLQTNELSKAAGEGGSWLWHGYLAAGKVTLLTSQWKSGKTTLISVLLARMHKGGVLAELPVAPGRAAVFSEEGAGNWNLRCRKLQMANHVSFFCQPFDTRPTLIQWRGVVEAMIELRRNEGLDLVVIDPLAVFLPGSNENSARDMMEWLLTLRAWTDRGLGVLLVHHPRKGTNLAGQAARGSGALASYVDVLIEMNWYGKPESDDRRRRLRAYSRHEETRRFLVLELNAAGTDYLAHNLPEYDNLAESSQALRLVLEDANERLTQRQILEQWPEDFRKPDPGTIRRELKRGVDQLLICRHGTGRRNDPHRYWLPGNETYFHPGPEASREEIERWEEALRTKSLKALLEVDSEPVESDQETEERSQESVVPKQGLMPDPLPHRPPRSDAPCESNPPKPMPVPMTGEPRAPAQSPHKTPAAPSEQFVEAERRRLRRWPHG